MIPFLLSCSMMASMEASLEYHRLHGFHEFASGMSHVMRRLPSREEMATHCPDFEADIRERADQMERNRQMIEPHEQRGRDGKFGGAVIDFVCVRCEPNAGGEDE